LLLDHGLEAHATWHGLPAHDTPRGGLLASAPPATLESGKDYARNLRVDAGGGVVMSEAWWIVAPLVLGLLLVAALAWGPVRAALREGQVARARKDFHKQRERLEAKFLKLASNSGKPRGLQWVDCDFEDDVAYARDRRSGNLSAFVAVTISFEAIEGGPMEDVEAVGNLRAATAVFTFAHGGWHTDGRAIFNLNPTEAIAYYQDFEMVAQELAQRR
jgi:hypothetical protein